MAQVTLQQLEEILREAGWVMMRMPGGVGGRVRIMDYGAVEDPNTAYGYTPAQPRRLVPSARDITMADEVVSWLAFIPEDKFVIRRIVALRMMWNGDLERHNHTFRGIAKMLGCSPRSVSGWHKSGLKVIATHLERNNRYLDKIRLYLKPEPALRSD